MTENQLRVESHCQLSVVITGFTQQSIVYATVIKTLVTLQSFSMMHVTFFTTFQAWNVAISIGLLVQTALDTNWRCLASKILVHLVHYSFYLLTYLLSDSDTKHRTSTSALILAKTTNPILSLQLVIFSFTRFRNLVAGCNYLVSNSIWPK